MNLSIINGPNLNLLGTREPHIYGSTTFESELDRLRAQFPGLRIDYFQSNSEGAIIDHIQQCRLLPADGIIINAGAYTHTSIAIADALSAVGIPAVEVHISNIMAREPFRRQSYLSAVCRGSICGLGLKGYELALTYFQATLS